MNETKQLSLIGTSESSDPQPLAPGLDRYPALAEAGRVLGMSGPALRKKFERAQLPRKFLLRIGPRTLRVDLAGLLQYLKRQANQVSA
jgi:hypothetical protein